MEFENESAQPALPQESQSFLDLLGKLSTVTPEQISALRAKMSTAHQMLFDTTVPEADKQVLALLDNLSDEELFALVGMEKKQGRLVGFHEVGGHLHTLTLLTENERYGRIIKAID